MLKLLKGNSKVIATLLTELDYNFIQMAGMLLKMAAPELTLKGYAENGSEPSAPAENDCYMVEADGTVWELEAEKDDLIFWNGAQWMVYPLKITETTGAANMAIAPVYGMAATTVQEAIEELAAAVLGSPDASGSGSSSGSGSGSGG